jgi:hypothetical protein
MKLIKMLRMTAVALFISGLVSSNSMATTGQSSATVILPITVEKITDLDFGSVVGGSIGQVLISSGNPTSRNTSTTVQTLGSNFSRGFFVVRGQPNTPWTYSVVPLQLSLSNGTSTMTVNLSPSQGSSTISNTGVQVLLIAGELLLDGTETAGAYSATYNVSVDY